MCDVIPKQDVMQYKNFLMNKIDPAAPILDEDLTEKQKVIRHYWDGAA